MITFEIDYEKIGNFDMSFPQEKYYELDQRVAKLKEQINQWIKNKNSEEISFIENT